MAQRVHSNTRGLPFTLNIVGPFVARLQYHTQYKCSACHPNMLRRVVYFKFTVEHTVVQTVSLPQYVLASYFQYSAAVLGSIRFARRSA